MKTLIICCFFLVLNSSCSKKYATNKLQNTFSKEEIEDLNKITNFFKNQICENKNSDFKTCFSEILPELINHGWQPIIEKVDFDKQKELYAHISKSTFNEIWDLTKSVNPETGVELESIGPKCKGKYQTFLTELGKNNTVIKKYVEDLITYGNFESMGLLQQAIYNNQSDFELDNPDIQLLIAVHYLTQNDQQKRTEKWAVE